MGLDQGEEAPTIEPDPPPAPEPPPTPPIATRRVGRPPAPAPAAPAPAAPAPVASTPAPAPPAPATTAPTPVAAAPAVAKAPASAKAPKPPKEKVARKGPTPKAFNRWSSLGGTLTALKTGTIEELVASANQHYIDQGGKNNAKESATVVKSSLNVLEKMGVVTVANGSFTVN